MSKSKKRRMKDTTAVKNLKKWKTVVNALKEWWKKIHKGQGKSAIPYEGHYVEDLFHDYKYAPKNIRSCCFVAISGQKEIETAKKIYEQQIEYSKIQGKEYAEGVLYNLSIDNAESNGAFDDLVKKQKDIVREKNNPAAQRPDSPKEEKKKSGRKQTCLFYKGEDPYQKDDQLTKKVAEHFLGYLRQHRLEKKDFSFEGLAAKKCKDTLNNAIIAFYKKWEELELIKKKPERGALADFFKEDCHRKGIAMEPWASKILKRVDGKCDDSVIEIKVRDYFRDTPLVTGNQ